ncbi:MAG: hypothetical protein QOJ88_1153 [Pyrinomonadaceae bacterium]|jgi:hypothetical protein|nr:hypothetical protein [Pyrinomonadaceae bacterium]
MPTRKSSSKTVADKPSGKRTDPRFASLFASTNRGLLLDVVVFILNVFLMRFLTRQVRNLFSQFSLEEPLAQLGVGLTLTAMWILPVAAAVLKRWHYHQRLKARAITLESSGMLAGCLFNPVFYFCLNLVISAGINASLGQFVFGDKGLDNGAVFVPLVFASLILTIVQTYLIYRYFSPPKKPPASEFLRSPKSELWGDVCIFLNMILFQVGWNLLTFNSVGRPADITEFFGRLLVLCFLALLLYFPPRMLYLAEDFGRRRTWLTMLIANSPVILRLLIGTSRSTPGW